MLTKQKEMMDIIFGILQYFSDMTGILKVVVNSLIDCSGNERDLDHECWCPRRWTVLQLIFTARFCAMLWSNISDCDETFNYWEPVSGFLSDNRETQDSLFYNTLNQTANIDAT